MKKTIRIAFGLLAVTLLVVSALPAQEMEKQVLGQLANPDPAVRRAAMAEFAQAEHRDIQEVLPVAQAALKDRDSQVRYYGIVALMATASMDVKSATALGQAAPALINRLGDSDPQVRGEAANALALTLPAPPRSAAEPLIVLLRDPEPGVQKAALGALARLGPVTPKVAPAVRDLLYDEDASLRAEAAKVLGELGGDPDNVWALINVLDDRDNFVRQNAVHALGKMGSAASAAIPHLQKIVNKKRGEDPTVREYALYALRSIRHQQ